MQKEAEVNAADDRRRREVVELKNQADNQIYTVDKQLKEHGAKLDESVRTEVEAKKTALAEALKGEDTEAIKKGSEELTAATNKIAEVLYKSTAGAGGAGGGEPGPEDGGAQGGGGGQRGGGQGSEGEKIVDADFEVKS
jgi:molecular chaperone DnaK